MFTGIIRHVGRIRETTSTRAGRQLAIELGPLAAGLQAGDSLAVDGACLTLNAPSAGGLGRFDVVTETLERTTLGELSAGDRVNLEPALRSGQGFDGHIVQGHVDGIARVARVHTGGGRWDIEFAAEPRLAEQMVPKGSVAVAGVSLTLAGVRDESFRVALIPTTLAETTLAEISVGREVNVETDVLGKYVRKYLAGIVAAETDRPAGRTLSLEQLRRAGFA